MPVACVIKFARIQGALVPRAIWSSGCKFTKFKPATIWPHVITNRVENAFNQSPRVRLLERRTICGIDFDVRHAGREVETNLSHAPMPHRQHSQRWDTVRSNLTKSKWRTLYSHWFKWHMTAHRSRHQLAIYIFNHLSFELFNAFQCRARQTIPLRLVSMALETTVSCNINR